MRWSRKNNKDIESRKTDSFLSEIHDVCKKHGFCIEHEDSQGGFILEKYNGEDDFEWLSNASIGATVDNP